MPKKQTKKTFWMKLHENRLKVVAITFLIIAPIALVAAIYIGSYIGGQRVHFDEERADSTVMITDFDDLDGINHLGLTVEWKELKLPTENTSGVLEGGYYGFAIGYSTKGVYNVSNVSITPLLQTPWTDVRSLGSVTTLSETARLVRIPFNHLMPISPLLFVTIAEPALYMKVTYTLDTTVGGIEQTAYVMFSLEGLNPALVLD